MSERSYSLVLVLVASLALGSTARAQNAEPAAPQEAAPPPEPSKIVASVGLGVPAYIYATPKTTGMGITPDQKLSLAESIAVGYVASPKLTWMLSGFFLETVRTNMGLTGWSFGGVSIFAAYRVWEGLSVTAGPMFWYRTYFTNQFDLGAIFSATYGIKLPDRFALSFSVGFPGTYLNKTTFAVVPGVGLAHRF